VIQDLSVQAISNEITFRVIDPDVKVYAHGEEELCYSIIANLVKNAVEAALPNSIITITLKAQSKAILQIHNHGSVPPDVRGNFFDKYSTSGKQGGTGLGTYSSDLLAHVQGGTLTMETSENSGTTLTLTLNQWQGAESNDSSSIQTGITDVLPAGEVKTLLEQRVLVVDDDEFNRMILLDQLAQLSLDVKFAINGLEAFELIKLWRPDTIVMDIEMPVLGGMDALLEIRAYQAQVSQSPSVIVAYSGHDDVQSHTAFLVHGFDHCLKKPCTKSELLALLRPT
jgi:CheY-like chemotaxis protein